MIYLDNAATTYPKPPSVIQAVQKALSRYGANPGRSGYDMAEDTDAMVYDCRRKLSDMFGAATPEDAVFTPGCTYAINFVLRGCLHPGDHVIISDLEHNAVVRTLHQLEREGISVTRVHIAEGNDELTMRGFRAALRRNTAMIFCTHASNVFGVRIPIERIGELCRREGIMFGVDAAQSAGTLPIDVSRQGIDYLCMPAHKGLYGIMGLGVLMISSQRLPDAVITGGTGSMSAHREQPRELPDRLESGTPGVPAIAALSAGIGEVARIGRERIFRHEMELTAHIYHELARMPAVTLYTLPPDDGRHVPVLSFNIGDMSASQAGERLAEMGIAVRTGLHCAPDAHAVYGTLGRGTIRICPSMFTSESDAQALIGAVYDIGK